MTRAQGDSSEPRATWYSARVLITGVGCIWLGLAPRLIAAQTVDVDAAVEEPAAVAVEEPAPLSPPTDPPGDSGDSAEFVVEESPEAPLAPPLLPTVAPGDSGDIVETIVDESLDAPLSPPTDAPGDSGDIVETIVDESLNAPLSPPTEAPGDSGDIVESIGDESLSAPLAPLAPPLQPTAATGAESSDRFELRGWLRQSLELGLAARSPRSATPDPARVPYNRLVERTQLHLRARYSHGGWFEANLSGLLSHSLYYRDQDRTVDVTGAEQSALRGVLEPQLRELFVGLFYKRLDVRIGQQRLAWGRGEFISPNDVVNARDLRDPFVGEQELRAVPTPLVRADVDLGFGALQGVFAPVFVPDRFDVFGTNWAGLQPGAPEQFRGMFGVLNRSLDPTLREPLQRLLVGTKLPRSDFSQPSLGARFSWSSGRFDVSHYYHYGYDGPMISVDRRVSAALAATDFTTAGLEDFQPLLRLIDAGQQPIRITYVRRHHIGTDVATTLGPFALRVDAAFQSKRVFFRRDLLGVTSPSIQVVGAIEYQTGDTNKVLLIEGMYLQLLKDPAAPLLIWDRQSWGVAGVLRWPLFDRVDCDLRAMIGIRPVTQVLQPQLNYRVDSWTISLGALWLSGEQLSFGQYFNRNTEVYAKVKGVF